MLITNAMLMQPSHSSLWPSLTSESTERLQPLGYTYDYPPYLPVYEPISSTGLPARDDVDSGRTLDFARSSLSSIRTAYQPHAAPPSGLHGDDLIWRDPSKTPKKSDYDDGVALWGDPDVVNARPVHNWLVGEGEDEDLEIALGRSPSPELGKENFKGCERGDSADEWPFPFPKPMNKKVVPTGWSEARAAANPFAAQQVAATEIPSLLPSDAADVFDFLWPENHTRDFERRKRSPPTVHAINELQALILGLRAVETDLQLLVDQIKNGVSHEIAWLLSHKGRLEFERIVLGIATMRTDISNFSKQLQSARNTDIMNDSMIRHDQPLYDFQFPL
ncbi:unnamed protein product [Cylicocyclus nassatus]|uniref:Uncharacterized protein n=1 Tax=Cylicocyclus nassatus TaxID=53992 RepID=A0AA36M609_CYLNA|nr:unnamed protein product [Cylicocyclus nassatus]